MSINRPVAVVVQAVAQLGHGLTGYRSTFGAQTNRITDNCAAGFALTGPRRTDRPKRDSAIVLNADFSVSPSVLPDLIRGIESGADVVVGEATQQPQSFGRRLVQLSSTCLLKPGLTMPGVQDLLSGVCAIRLATLKRCLHEREGALLETDGGCARAELVARVST